MKHPDIQDCAVFAKPSQAWGEVPAAWVVLKPHININADVSKIRLKNKKPASPLLNTTAVYETC